MRVAEPGQPDRLAQLGEQFDRDGQQTGLARREIRQQPRQQDKTGRDFRQIGLPAVAVA